MAQSTSHDGGRILPSLLTKSNIGSKRSSSFSSEQPSII